MVKTSKVKGRRTLRFENAEDVFADCDALAAAEKRGGLTSLGNWSLGQAINHLAVWAEFAFSGTPIPAPWYLRIFARVFKKRILNKGFVAGVRFRNVEGGTLGAEPTPTHAAIARYRLALDRLAHETPHASNPLLGALTREEWIALHLRHAELHLSFFTPQPPQM